MNDKERMLPSDTMGLIIHCKEDGGMEIFTGHNFTDDFDKHAVHDFDMILDGLNYMLKYQTEFKHQLGEMAMLAGRGLTEEEQRMIEEYDRNQAEASEGKSKPANILQFPKGKLH